MIPISVVIIAKDEAHIISKTIQSVKSLTDDILVCDTGSIDATVPIAIKSGASVIELSWHGYGQSKNEANDHALYDWVLQLDADEVADEELIKELHKVNLKDPKQIFTVKRKNYFKTKRIRFGPWRNDNPIRLFNRTEAEWNTDVVHEKLIYPGSCIISNLKGSIHHYTIQSEQEFEERMTKYGIKSAEKYFKQGVRGAWYKQFLSPAFTFIKDFFFRFGFLDGIEGWIIAAINAKYTRIKYQTLYKLQHTQKKD